MKLISTLFQIEEFNLSWKRLMFQGGLIIVLGVTLVLASIFSPDSIIMSAREFSWLPVTGMVILALGLHECLEAFFAKALRDFHHNLQVGILDIVIGGLIIFSVSEDPARISMMIAAFLIVRGSVRVALVHALGLPHKYSTSFMGITAVIMGFLICFNWPTAESWFLALCLSLEIIFRGWAMIIFSLWVKRKNSPPLDHIESH